MGDETGGLSAPNFVKTPKRFCDALRPFLFAQGPLLFKQNPFYLHKILFFLYLYKIPFCLYSHIYWFSALVDSSNNAKFAYLRQSLFKIIPSCGFWFLFLRDYNCRHRYSLLQRYFYSWMPTDRHSFWYLLTAFGPVAASREEGKFARIFLSRKRKMLRDPRARRLSYVSLHLARNF